MKIVVENLMIGMGLGLLAGVLSRLKGRKAAPAIEASSKMGSARVMVLAVSGSGGFAIQPAERK